MFAKSHRDIKLPSLQEGESIDSKKFKGLKGLIKEFMEKRKDLKEFEEELKKNKDDITPNEIGEA